MGEITADAAVYKCRGCPRQFDSPADICQVEGCNLCRRCHVTALGFLPTGKQPHDHNDADQLGPELAKRVHGSSSKKNS
jgi:hypothetical protein